MAKSRLTGTPRKKEVVETAVRKKRSTATATNSAKTVKKSVKATTETSSVCEPSAISPQETETSSVCEPSAISSQEVEALHTCKSFAELPAVSVPSLENLSNEAILPSSSPLPSTIEVTCDSREFNDYVQALKGIIPSNSSHPILCNISIEADAETQHLHLTAYNLEFGMQVSFDANVDRSGKLTLPAPILADILGKFPNGNLTLKSSSEIIKGSDVSSVSATLSASKSKHVIRGVAASEFPVIPSVERKLVTLPASVLIAALKASLFAVCSEENKRILTGANFQLDRDTDRGLDKLRIWTTDGHRVAMVVGLSENNNSNPSIDRPVQFTVPAKVLRVLERNLNPTDRIAIYYDGSAQQSTNIVTFQWENWRLTAQLLEGQYPVCDRIIAPHRHLFSNQLIVERQALLKALERLASHSDKSHVTVILELDSEFQQVMASINNTISSGNETIDAKISGGNFRVKCDIRYLIDTAKAISSSDLRILMTAPTAPLLIVPFGIPSLGTEALDCEYIVAPQE